MAENSGNNPKLSGKVVYLRRNISVGVKNRNEGKLIHIAKGSVGTLTGGFINKKVNGRFETFLDMKIGIMINGLEFSKRYMMLVSVPLSDLKFDSDFQIN